jgi:hypothetical protein
MTTNENNLNRADLDSYKVELRDMEFADLVEELIEQRGAPVRGWKYQYVRSELSDRGELLSEDGFEQAMEGVNLIEMLDSKEIADLVERAIDRGELELSGGNDYANAEELEHTDRELRELGERVELGFEGTDAEIEKLREVLDRGFLGRLRWLVTGR